MTIKEIQAMQLAISTDGFALGVPSKDGQSVQPIREITQQEIATMLSAMYYTHISAHPDDKIMIMPLDDKGNALAVGFAHIAVPAAPAAPVPEASASGKKPTSKRKPAAGRKSKTK